MPVETKVTFVGVNGDYSAKVEGGYIRRKAKETSVLVDVGDEVYCIPFEVIRKKAHDAGYRIVVVGQPG